MPGPRACDSRSGPLASRRLTPGQSTKGIVAPRRSPGSAVVRGRCRLAPAPLALALHALTASKLAFTGGTEQSVVDFDLPLSLVVANDHAFGRDAGPGQLERMRRRAVGEQLFAAAKHDRHR